MTKQTTIVVTGALRVNVYAEFIKTITYGWKPMAISSFYIFSIPITPFSEKCHLAIPLAILSILYTKFYYLVENLWQFPFFTFSAFQSLHSVKCHLAIPLATLSILYTKFYQISHMVKDLQQLPYFYISGLSIASVSGEWHLTSLLATSCPYKFICKEIIKYS